MAVYVSQSEVASSIPFDNSTNGFISTDVQSAIEEARFSINNQEIGSAANATTSSSTDALLTSMTLTPVAGTYLVLFTTTITSNNAGAAISASVYVGGTQQPNTLMKISPLDGGTLSVGSARGAMAITEIVTVNGAQAIEIRWSTSGGTATCGPRNLIILRVS